MALLFKMSMNSMMHVRKLRACMMLIVHVPVNNVIARAQLEAGQEYDKKIKELSHDQVAKRNYGPPHVHKWVALIRACLAVAEQYKNLDEQLGDSAHKALMEYFTSYLMPDGTVPRLMLTINHLKSKMDYNKKNVMIESNVAPESPENQIKATVLEVAVKLAKGSMKNGTALLTEMERNAQQRLDALSSWA